MEQQKIASLIMEVKKQNVGVVLVSHNLRQVHDLSDRVVVLLHGHRVANLRPTDVSVEDLVRWITGVALETGMPASTGASG